jgi:hypothetical protein
MAQAVGELGEIALEIREVDHAAAGRWRNICDRISRLPVAGGGWGPPVTP